MCAQSAFATTLSRGVKTELTVGSWESGVVPGMFSDEYKPDPRIENFNSKPKTHQTHPSSPHPPETICHTPKFQLDSSPGGQGIADGVSPTSPREGSGALRLLPYRCYADVCQEFMGSFLGVRSLTFPSHIWPLFNASFGKLSRERLEGMIWSASLA